MTDDDSTSGPRRAPRIGQPPTTRRAALTKLLWIGIWLVFLNDPVQDLLHGGHGTGGDLLGACGLAAFVGVYLVVVFRNPARDPDTARVGAVIALLTVIALLLTLALGEPWLVLFVYLAVVCGSALPMRPACWCIAGSTVLMTCLGYAIGHRPTPGLVIPAVLAGFSMTGVRQLLRITVELRRARATVAALAANEERLRLARDLHDLLGHSLSLITLKSELAGRMLPDRPAAAAEQVADIEQVSRQALTDVREAVSGYRRPRLAGELAGAQVALTAAGISADVPADPGLDGVPEEQEAALAWALREAVTNVVRHSGARRCTVGVQRRQTLDGPRLELTVTDDGTGQAGPAGNGLTGLAERLEAVGGTLEAAPVRRGFRLLARVPLAPGPVPLSPAVGSGA